MRMPVAGRSEDLVRRPHVGKAHFGALRDRAFGVSGLYSLGYLVGCLAFHSELGPQLVIRQYGSYCLRVETDRSPGFCVVRYESPDLDRSERRRAAHDDTHKAVIPLVHGLVTTRPSKNSD